MTGSGTALQHIDEALAAWNDRLAAVADTLLDLQADTTYRTLSGRSLAGRTRVRWQPAADAMLTVYEHFALLRDTIERAQILRKAVPRVFGTEAKLAEIHTLLFQPSIALPQAAVRSTPEDLLAAMVAALAVTRAAVQELAEAGTELAESLRRIEQEMAWLNGQLSSPKASALEEARRMLGELKLTIAADPLGALDGLRTRIQPIVTRVSRAAHAGTRLRQRIEQGLPLLAQLTRVREGCLAAAADVATKISSAACPPVSEQVLESLAQWLERLEHTRREGKLEAAEVGLRNWLRVTEQTLTQQTECLAAWQQLLNHWSELRGRLDALRAKARSYGVAESPPLAAAAAHAEQMLKAKPADLTAASLAVVTYEKLLTSTRGRP